MSKFSWGSSLFLAIILFTIPKLTSSAPNYLGNYCSNTTTFAASDTSYPKNLNTVLNSLSSAAAITGFATASAGNGTDDAVFGLFLCSGYLTPSSCSYCVAMAMKYQPKVTTCPRSKVGIIWYDECMIRHDNQNFFGRMDRAPALGLFNTQNITGNQTRFTELLGDTLTGLAVQTADGGTGKYGTRAVNFTSLETLFVLEQCTPDLSDSDCVECLMLAIEQMVVRQGGRILQPSCNVRYEIYRFFNGTTNISSPPPSSPPLATTNSSTGAGSGTGNGKSTEMKKGSSHIAVVVALPLMLAVLLLCSVCFCYRYRKSREPSPEELEEITTAESLQFDFRTVRAATDNFSLSNKLGEGGFGGVYKGRLPNGHEIAVKRLSANSGQGSREFKTEVLLVARLQHKNLVRLLGFCLQKDEKLLVYELLPNSSLDKVLLDRSKDVSVDWETRYKIIAGIARGLLYLHEDSRLKIIHRDLKSSNILLDESMNPKISDFGLAKLVGTSQIQADTNRIVGTYGYMAPEYAMTGRFSIKSDVYSFGIIVLEIVSGHKCNSTAFPYHEESLIQRAWRLWNDVKALEMVDPRLGGNFSSNEVSKCIHIGLLCIQEHANRRPTMVPIVSALNGHPVDLPTPSPPQLASTGHVSPQTSSTFSGNKDSITELYPR